MENIRQDFPILETKVNGNQLIYLDNAATMQMPMAVQERMQLFYKTENANIHRGIHTLSENATFQYECVRKKVCQFLRGKKEDKVIFTSGTTDAINQAAEMIGEFLEPGDEIITTAMEHHANFIPWYQLARRYKVKLQIVEVDSRGQIKLDHLESLLSEKTKLVTFTELSNVTGIENPVNEMTALVRSLSNAWILIDGAQGIVHCRKELSDVDCDFYCFSGHKLGAPTGTGALYIKESVFQRLSPSRYGGGTVDKVCRDEIIFVNGPSAFEPGTPNYAGVIGLGTALDYWSLHKDAADRENELVRELERGLRAIEGVHILGETDHRRGCVSIVIDNVHSYDFCKFLDLNGIAVRSGHLCAMPYLNAFHVEYAVRFSVAPYNTLDEIYITIKKCKEIIKWLRRHKKNLDEN